MRVTDAANESKDNVKYLTTLEKALEPMYVGDVRKILDGVPALMNSVKMMYAVCRYFHQRERMTRLFHKITNRMIYVCKEFLNELGTLWKKGGSIFITWYVAIVGVMIAFFSVIHIVALELDDPYGQDGSDLPLEKMRLGLWHDLDAIYEMYENNNSLAGARRRRKNEGDERGRTCSRAS